MTQPKIERPNTVAGLLEKRAELARFLKHLRSEEKKVICDLDHVDAAIRLFDPIADAKRVVLYPTKHRAKKGEVVRLAVRMLKAADRPLTSLDIVHQQIKERGLKADDATVVLLRKRIGACLTKLKNDGYVRVVPQPGLYQGWGVGPMTVRHQPEPIRFWRGRRLYQIANVHDGEGFMGLCDGRVVATAPDRPSVMRAILMTARWAT